MIDVAKLVGKLKQLTRRQVLAGALVTGLVVLGLGWGISGLGGPSVQGLGSSLTSVSELNGANDSLKTAVTADAAMSTGTADTSVTTGLAVDGPAGAEQTRGTSVVSTIETTANITANSILPSRETLTSPEAAATETPGADFQPASGQLEKVMALNDDIVAWLNIPGTEINYPVVYSADNYYLDHDYLGRASKAGAVIMDSCAEGPLNGRNTIISAHNMKNGTMFHDLRYFKDRTFAKSHGRFTIESEDGITEWQVFSCYVSDIGFNFIKSSFASDQDNAKFLETIEGKSKFDFQQDLSSSDQIVTLYTCTYEVANARFVVHAKRVG